MLKYILLGIVQGITEFFPVSSSGHLVIAQKLLGMRGEEVGISVILHLGTCLALIVFFFNDILKLWRNKKTLWLALVVTFITGVIGIGGKDFFESLFSSAEVVALTLLITGTILILTKRFSNGKREKIGIKDALILGLTQGAAIVPGISRSGITISTLLFRGINPGVSFNFSFLASIPAVLGAALLEAKEINLVLKGDAKSLVAGFIFSFLTGLLALTLLKKILQRAKFHYFGYYCIVLAAALVIYLRLN